MVRGIERALVGAGVVGTTDTLWVTAEPVEPDSPGDAERELAGEYRAHARALLSELGGQRLAAGLDDTEDPGALADTAGWWPNLSHERRTLLLETLDVAERLRRAISWVKEALAEARVANEIRTEAHETMERTQRACSAPWPTAAIPSSWPPTTPGPPPTPTVPSASWTDASSPRARRQNEPAAVA